MKLHEVFGIFLFSLQFSEKLKIVDANYLVTLMEFEILVKNDTEFMNLDSVKVKRKSRNEPHKLYGSFTFHQAFTEKVEMWGQVYTKQGGEYRKTAFHLKGSACQKLDTDEGFFPSLANASGLPLNVSWFNLIIKNDIFNFI